MIRFSAETYPQWRNETILQGYAWFAIGCGVRPLTTTGKLPFLRTDTDGSMVFENGTVDTLINGTADSLLLYDSDGTFLGSVPGLKLFRAALLIGETVTLTHFSLKLEEA